MLVVKGAGAAAGAGLGAGVVAIGALCGSTLGEQAANSARQAKGVISIKRLRVGVCILGFLVWSGLSLGCQGAIARQRTSALTQSDSRGYIACDSGFVSVRCCTNLTEFMDDSKGSNPSLPWHLAVDTDNLWTGSEIVHERPQMAGAKHQPQPRDVGMQPFADFHPTQVCWLNSN
jgi:hypothetical protein